MKAYQSPKIETIVVQHQWLEDETLVADIILPANTMLEEDDIGIDTMSGQFCSVYPCPKACNSVGESMSDYEIVVEIAKKLGLYEQFTEGKSVSDWIRVGYDTCGIKDDISWEDFNEKDIMLFQLCRTGKKTCGNVSFCKDPDKNPLVNSNRENRDIFDKLAENFPDDPVRGPMARWIAEMKIIKNVSHAIGLMIIPCL
jgi:trimethylamine-N-oxide reductase (cytochrome c)